MPEDPSQKLSIGNWDGKILPKEVHKDISIILKSNMRDAPSPPQPKKGRGIAKGQTMPEDPSQKLSIGN
ncbi:hypothetical protein SLA2020_100340 [Shorea laevis]